MEIIPITPYLKEARLCKGLRSTLTGSALIWLYNVPPYSVTSSFSNILLCIINWVFVERLGELRVQITETSQDVRGTLMNGLDKSES